MKPRERLEPDDRSRKILIAGAWLAVENGLHKLTRDGVAAKAGCSAGLVNAYFETTENLKREIVLEAIRVGGPASIIDEAVGLRYPEAIAYRAIQA